MCLWIIHYLLVLFMLMGCFGLVDLFVWSRATKTIVTNKLLSCKSTFSFYLLKQKKITYLLSWCTMSTYTLVCEMFHLCCFLNLTLYTVSDGRWFGSAVVWILEPKSRCLGFDSGGSNSIFYFKFACSPDKTIGTVFYMGKNIH